jgi:hypothetical protein
MHELMRGVSDWKPDKSTQEILIDDFARCAAYTAIQAPIESLSQFASQLTGEQVSLKPIITPIEQAEFGGMRWHVQQLGTAIGMTVPFLTIYKGMGVAFGRGTLAADMTLARRALTGAVTGFAYDTIFRPVNADEMDTFALSKVKNGAIGAVTFASVIGAESAITSARITGRNSSRVYFDLQPPLVRKLATHGLAGATIGALSEQTKSLVSGQGFADAKDTAKTAYQYGFLSVAVPMFNHMDAASSSKRTANFESLKRPTFSEHAELMANPTRQKESAVRNADVATTNVLLVTPPTAQNFFVEARPEPNGSFGTKRTVVDAALKADPVIGPETFQIIRDQLRDSTKRVPVSGRSPYFVNEVLNRVKRPASEYRWTAQTFPVDGLGS